MSTARAWQRMLSGRRLDLLDPSPIDVEIGDIAHGLSRVARWNGQTNGEWAYSVAQHSLLVTAIASHRGLAARWRMAALLHDAPEYVTGDLITPFKTAVGQDYKALEERLAVAIHIRFGLPAILPKAVAGAIKRADRIAARLEATRLAGFSEPDARRYFGRPADIPAAAIDSLLDPWPPDKAKRLFLEKFTEPVA